MARLTALAAMIPPNDQWLRGKVIGSLNGLADLIALRTLEGLASLVEGCGSLSGLTGVILRTPQGSASLCGGV